MLAGHSPIVELRLAAGGGESLQSVGKLLQRLQNRIFAQIGECQANVIGVMKRVFGNGTPLEAANEFLVAHGVRLTESAASPCWSRSPRPRLCKSPDSPR